MLAGLVPVAALTVAVDGGTRDRLSGFWLALLLVGTVAAVSGLGLIATDRFAAGGAAMVLATLTLPTGLAFILDLVLAAFAIRF